MQEEHCEAQTLVNSRKLSIDGDFQIIQIYDEITPLKQMSDKDPIRKLRWLLVLYKGIVLATSSIELKVFKSYLKIFSIRHPKESNPFFTTSKRTVDGEERISIKCKFDPDRFIAASEAMAMVEEINESMLGYLKKKYYENSNASAYKTFSEVADRLHIMEEIVRHINNKSAVDQTIDLLIEHLPRYQLKNDK